jgi:hypothetical protein
MVMFFRGVRSEECGVRYDSRSEECGVRYDSRSEECGVRYDSWKKKER